MPEDVVGFRVAMNDDVNVSVFLRLVDVLRRCDWK
jgi:hypothetical protein